MRPLDYMFLMFMLVCSVSVGRWMLCIIMMLVLDYYQHFGWFDWVWTN